MKTLHQIKPAFRGTAEQQLIAVAMHYMDPDLRFRINQGRLQYRWTTSWYMMPVPSSDADYYLREARSRNLNIGQLDRSWYLS